MLFQQSVRPFEVPKFRIAISWKCIANLIPLKVNSLHQKQRDERHPQPMWKKPWTTRSVHVSSEKITTLRTTGEAESSCAVLVCERTTGKMARTEITSPNARLTRTSRDKAVRIHRKKLTISSNQRTTNVSLDEKLAQSCRPQVHNVQQEHNGPIPEESTHQTLQSRHSHHTMQSIQKLGISTSLILKKRLQSSSLTSIGPHRGGDQCCHFRRDTNQTNLRLCSSVADQSPARQMILSRKNLMPDFDFNWIHFNLGKHM